MKFSKIQYYISSFLGEFTFYLQKLEEKHIFSPNHISLAQLVAIYEKIKVKNKQF